MRSSNLLYALKRLVFCFFTICASSQLLAESVIQVSGNDSTKSSYIEKLTLICLKEAKKEEIPFQRADLINEVMKVRIRQCLINSDLFSQVTVTLYERKGEAPNEQENIAVEVVDKYSRIVLPTYYQSQVFLDTVWGALFYDANMRGRGESGGFLYTHQQDTNRDSYSFFYEIPYLDAEGKHGFTLIGYKRDADFYSFTKSSWTYRTREQFQFLWLRAAYHMNTKTSLLYGYAPSRLAYTNPMARDGTARADDIDYITQSINLGMRWDATNQERYYRKGVSLEHTYYHQLSRTDKQDQSSVYLLDFYWGIPSWDQNILTARIAGGTFDSADPLDNLRIGSEHGSRGIPDHGGWNSAYLTLGIDYEFPLAKGQYGYWTVAPFVDYGYQWGVFHHPKSEFSYYATGIASYVYLRQVNLPALGFFISSNSEYLKDFVTFYIGFQL